MKPRIGGWRVALAIVTAVTLVMTTLTPAASAGPGDIEGTVFRDTDFDGARAGEVGEPGIEVTARDASGASVSTLSTSDGSYILDVSALTSPVTVQFTLPAAKQVFLRPGPMGVDNRSDVRVAAAGDTGVDFGVINPSTYCQDNPDVITNCYITGDQTGGGDVMIRTEFNASGDAVNGTGTPEQVVGDSAVIGTTYGVDIQTFRDNDDGNDWIWASSFMKRFSGYGPGGPGRIYRIDNFGNLLGSIDIAAGVDPHEYTPVNFAGDFVDGASYGEVGKQSFGDLEISEDETKLYVVNLFDRRVYEVDIDPASPTFETVLQSWDAGSMESCAGGTLRPGGLAVKDGRVYVGTTCDDATFAYVHSFNPLDTPATYTQEVVIPLGYAREPIGNHTGLVADWRPWNDNWVADVTGWGVEHGNPQPWLSGLDIGEAGMVIGIRDRYGDQSGSGTLASDFPATPGFYDTDSAGDILWACRNGTSFDLEGTGSCTINSGDTDAGGVNGDEWFDGDEYITGPRPGHDEISLGGVFIHPQTGVVIMSAYDSLDDNFGEYAFSQGLARLDPVTGDKIGQYRITDGPFGKAGGLGDIEAICHGGSIEIGNYVWVDTDGDGIQGPDESPLPGVTVTNTETGESVVTGPDGYYSFTIQPGDAYTLTFDTSTSSSPDPLVLTQPDAGSNDELDSDATIEGAGLPTITGTGGFGGDNDHSLDVGFIPVNNRIGNLVWLDLDNDTLVDVDEPGIGGVTVQLYQESGDTPGFDALDTVVDTTTTDATGNYWFEDLADTETYYVAVPADQSANTLVAAGETIDPATIVSSTGGDLINNDNDNVDDGDPVTGYLSVSGPIDLVDGAEVTAETDTNTGTDAETHVEAGGARDVLDTNSNLTVDLGFTQTNRIGNKVWVDGAEGDAGFNDGVADAAESADGIGGVTVQLYLDSTIDGTPGVFDAGIDLLVDTTVTDTDGSYWFDGVMDGTYFVGIPSGQTGQTVDGVAADLDDYVSSTAAVSDPSAGLDDLDDGDPAPGFASLTGAFDVASGMNPTDEAGDFQDGTDNGQETDINTKSGTFYADGNSDLTIDLGFIEAPKYALGNLVWVDANDNGIAEIGEPGIEGVTVQLYDDADNLVATEVTDVNGHYAFEDLKAGDYRVVIPAGQTGQTIGADSVDLDDLLPSAVVAADPDDPADVDNDNNGADSGTEITSGIVSIGDPDLLNPSEPTDEQLRSNDPADDDDGGSTTDAQRNFTVDFGFVQPLRVGNLVWLDNGGVEGSTYVNTDENDGEADPAESGIAGVLVQLLDDEGTVIAETVTDASGNYWFDGLRPGDYQVGIPGNQLTVLPDPPTGIDPAALDGLGSSTGQSLTGETADDDDDGDPSGAFASLSALFNLDYGTEAVDENGDFAGGADDESETAANVGTGDATIDENSNLEIDFGFSPVPTYRLGNLVWVETDDDGIAEDGELGVPGLLVQLLDDQGDVVAEAITDAQGQYLFDDLTAGDYQVRIPNDQTATLGGTDGTAGLFDDYRTAGTPEANADGNADNDNNGVEDADGLTSGVVTLGDIAGEPVDETLRSDLGTLDEDGTMIDNRSNLTVDFGLTPLYRLGNLVWEDYDNDGVAEDGEPGIEGVLVQLLDDADVVIAETVTDADGKYEFDELEAGDYRVNIPGDQTPDLADPQPDVIAGVLDELTTSGTPDATPENGDDNDNNGVETSGDHTSGVVTLGNTEPTAETLRSDDALLDEDGAWPDTNSDLTVDFGFFRGLRLGNQVFLDGQQGDGATYNNGIFDPGEVGISGVAVELWLDDGDGVFNPDDDTLVDTTNTDSEGNYYFDDLDPNTPYFVAVEDIGNGFATTEPVTGNPTDDDNDNDGAPTAGYDSVTDVITLIDPATGPSSVNEQDTNPGGDDLAETEANTAGTIYPDQNSELQVDLGFIDVPLYRIGNLVWDDVDNDGIAEDGEVGIPGVTVQLLDENGDLVATDVTDGDGKYDFGLLLAGTYTVSIPMDQAALVDMDSSNVGEDAAPNDLTDADNNDNGTITTADAWTSDPIIIGVDTPPFGVEPTDETLRDGVATDDDPDVSFYNDNRSNYTVDFGFLDVPKYSLGNQIWIDSNDDGIADAGEPGIAGVTVNLLDDAGDVVDTTVTGTDGTYLFEGLEAGDYAVEIPAGQTGQTIDEGAGRSVDLQDLLVSSVEYADPTDDTDNDNNGVDQGDGSVQTGLIAVGDPDRLNPSEPADEVNRNGGDDDDGGATTDEQRNLTLDIGFTEPLRVGNLVWLDDGGASTDNYSAPTEDDGQADATEPGIGGVTVNLLDDAGDVIATTTTNSDGNYYFDGLRAGDYQVAIPAGQAALAGVESSTGISATGETADDDDDGEPNDADGWASISEVFNLNHNAEAADELGDFGTGVGTEAEDAANAAGYDHVDNDSNLEIDFGFSPVPTYRLGNLVWEDYNDDGVADDGEPGIEGVLVQLLDDDGDVIAETVTDADGNYVFDGLPAGSYQVHVPGDQESDLVVPTTGMIPGVLDGLSTSGTPNGADDETDNDNNGVASADDFTSGVIELGEGTGNEEPTGETLRDDDATSDEDGALRDDRSELTVDIGLSRGLRLGNQVFLDGQQGDTGYNNGVLDAGETGLAEVTVELWEDDGDGVFSPDDDTLVATTTTDAEGNYSFGNLDEATPYFVAIEDVGTGYSSTGQAVDPIADDNVDDGAPTAGYDAVSNVVTLTTAGATTGEVDTVPTGDDAADVEADTAGDDYPDNNSEMTVDFGFVDVPLYRIGNLVWEDLDNDGIAEDGESGINGVTVNLLDENGDIIATTTTAASPGGQDGWYEFPNLMAGDYQVSIPMDQAVLEGKGSSDNNEELLPNDDGDNNDNGLIDTGLIDGDAWTSGVVSVGDPTANDAADFGTEPADETLRDGVATDDDDNGGFYSDDRSNYSVDFGFLDIPKYEIGNLVWVDSNDDGIADDGEPGIGGVELELLDEDGNVVQTTTTDPDGSYLFTDLDAGSYQVTIPAGQTGQTIDDGTNKPVDLQDLLLSEVSVADPDSPADVDNDSNGVEPTADGEPITAGFVTVGDDGTGTLDELNPAEPTDETDRDGTTDIDPNDDVEDAKQNATVDFGFVEPLRIGNLVWLDDGGEATDSYDAPTEDDGVADSTELGIEGVLVQLLEDGVVIAETVTDANGNYYFDGLRKGDYRVAIPTDQVSDLPVPTTGIVAGALDGVRSSTGKSLTPEADDDTDDGNSASVGGWASLSDEFNLDHGTEAADELGDFGTGVGTEAEDAANAATVNHDDDDSNLEIDFGFSPVPTYRLGNLVWEDYNDDGVADDGEPGIAGVTVELLDENGDVVETVVTDGDGHYEFTGLEAGDYQINIPADQTVLEGLNTSGTPNGADDETDNDNNGVASADDFTSGVIELGEGTGNEEPTGETLRDDDATLDEDGALRDDRSELTVDFGFYRGLRLGNQVFLDGEQGDPGYNNGVFDAGETGISGVTVELWEDDGDGVFNPDDDTLVATTATDSEGNYSFGNLDDATPYFVAIEDVGTGYSSSGQSADPIAADNADDGAPGSDYASVSKNPITLTIEGATTGEVDTVPTGDDGADVEANAAGDDYPDNNSEMTVDFGFVEMPLYRIGNLVWEDLDNDGLAEDGESGINGVTVNLLDENGDIIATTVTAASPGGQDGWYEFPNLMAGDYQVSIPMDQAVLDDMGSSDNNEELLPNDDGDNNDNGLIDTGLIDGDAWTSGVVSVGDPALTDPADFGTEPADETLRDAVATDDDDNGGFYTDDRSNYSVDFGFLDIPKYEIGNLVWVDSNDDGVADDGEPGIGGVELELLDEDGNVVQTTTTDPDGSYLFTDLDAGSYQVTIPADQTGQTIDDGTDKPVDLQDLLPSAINVADPDEPTDVDNDSNGVEEPDGTITAGFVTVGDDGTGTLDELNPAEPTDETDRDGTTDIDPNDDVEDAKQNATVDFGFAEPLRIGNQVFLDDGGEATGNYDANNQDNGIADDNESGVEGVLVQLLDENGDVIAETVTDANGNYYFDDLRQGDYQVGIPADQEPELGDQPDIIDGATDGLQSSNGQSTTAETSDDDDDGDPAGDFLTVSDTVTLDHGTEATDEAGDLSDPTDEAAETAANAATSNHDDDDSNLEVDLGLTPIPTYRIGSLVWEDFDNDGIAETGEPGIEGVLVQLVDENGDVIAETVTDSDGEYVFDDLLAGDYQVVLPAGQEPELGDQPDIIADVLDGLNTSGTPEGAADNDVDNDNNGVDTADGLTSGVITLGEGDTKDEPTGEVDRVDSTTSDEDGTIRDDRSNQTVDFGLFRGLRLGNQVFLDGEQGEPGYNNGVFDAGETGISGVTVELWEDDGDGVFDPETDTLISTTPTDSEGNYSFGNVEPDTPYFIAIEEIGIGYSSSGQSDDVVAADNVDDAGPSAGYDAVTSVITLAEPSAEETTTDETDTNPTDDEAADEEVDAATGEFYPDGNSEMTVDLGFVEVPLYQIGNLVWEDIDNDGVAEDGEPGINGVTVNLLDDNGDIVATTTTSTDPDTGADGWYEFPNLMAGDYQVSIPMDQAVLDDMGSSDNNEELSPNDDGDNNDNGLIDTGLIDGDAWTSGVVSVGDPTLTDPADFGTEPTDETQRSDDATDSDDNGGFYTDDRSNYSVDFGFLDIPKYEIGNLVWVDHNDDGIADAGEPGIGGVELELLDEDGNVVQTTTTDPDGSYLFTDLDAGSYQVTIPADQTGQTIDDGADTPVNLSDLLPGAVVASDPDSPADVDNDNNGVEEPDGTITAGFVTVGDDGTGTFDELNPAEPTDETDRDGGTDIDPNDDVEDAKQNATVDFGFVEPLRVGSLVWLDDGGETTGDYDAPTEDDGIADATEVGIEGVLVQLLDENGDVIAETVTDANGNYYFEDLRQGDYQVGIPADQEPELGDQPDIIPGALDTVRSSTGQSTTPETSDDDDDGNPDDANGWASLSEPFGLERTDEAVNEAGDLNDPTVDGAEDTANAVTGPHNDDNSNLEVDFGFSPLPTYRIGDLVWEDYDDDGIAEAGEPGIEGILVQLLDENGDVVAETVTDSEGNYAFTELEPGDYQVHIPADQTPDLDEPQPGIIPGVLDGLQSSGTPNGADDESNNDNNGVPAGPGAGVDITSGVIELGEGTGNEEPTDEETRSDDSTPVEDGTLRDDRSELTVDIGLFRGLRLGNQVFLDGEQGEPGYNNGVFDAGETGISGVTVELWEDDGDGVFDPAVDTLIDTTVTDSEGNYVFGNLEPETPYFVAVEDIGIGSATETVSSDPTATDNDNDGAPAAGYDSVSDAITLTIGGTTTDEADTVPTGDDPSDPEADTAGDDYPDANSEMTVDLGFIDLPLYRIGNLVWEDLDNDGIAESGEPGIEGVTVQLLDADGNLVDEVVTDADGSYEFLNLMAGQYQVSIPMDQPALDGFASSNEGDETDPNADVDNNDNGLDGVGPDGSSAWVSGPVQLGPDPLVIPFGSEPTDETVRADDPTDDDEAGGFFTDERSNHSVDFGFYQLTLGSQVWIDTNADGVLDPTEQPVDGVPVNLYQLADDGALIQVDETTTSTINGEPGSYLFTGLESGATYVVEIPTEAFAEGAPLEYLYSTPDPVSGAPDPDDDPTNGDDNGVDAPAGDPIRSLPVTLVTGDEPTGEPSLASGAQDGNENLTVDFGVTALSLGGTIWEDTTEDGVLAGATEPVVAGVPVELWAVNPATGEVLGDTPTAVTTTATDGTYLFDGLVPGDYVVRVPVDAMSASGPLAGMTSSVGNGVTPPDPDDSMDFDDNGVLTIDGWVQTPPVSLDYGDEPIGEPETGSAGDASDNHTVDLGFVPAPPMAVGNRVWEDLNEDGIQDPDEDGIEDVVLELIDVATGDVVATTMTDENGFYLFGDLLPGTYVVQVAASNMVGQGELAAHKSSDAYDETDPDLDPSDDDDQGIEADGIVASAPFTLTPTFEPVGETDCGCPDAAAVDMNTNLTVDFGFYPAGVDVRPTPETISGAIFLDVASTGGFSTQSTPIEGVKLTITLADTGEVIGEVVTDENGFWSQIALVPGEYEVRIDDSNFEDDGVLVGLTLLDETERTITITAGDEPDTSAFGNEVDERLGLAMPAEPDRDVPTEPLAFTGGDRQKQLAVVATMFLVLGMLTLWASRRREEHELDN